MKKVAVLGLGPSLKLFNRSEYLWTIGVNDIWRCHQTEAIICLNHRNSFGNDRLRVIDESKPKVFYSQIANWSVRPDFYKIELTHYYPAVEIKLENPQFYKSYCSPFVACQIAIKYYMAEEIHLFGVDLVDHQHLDQQICSKIKNHFLLLAKALEKEGCKFVVHGEGILKNI